MLLDPAWRIFTSPHPTPMWRQRRTPSTPVTRRALVMIFGLVFCVSCWAFSRLYHISFWFYTVSISNVSHHHKNVDKGLVKQKRPTYVSSPSPVSKLWRRLWISMQQAQAFVPSSGRTDEKPMKSSWRWVGGLIASTNGLGILPLTCFWEEKTLFNKATWKGVGQISRKISRAPDPQYGRVLRAQVW